MQRGPPPSNPPLPLWLLGSAAAPEARQHGARCAHQAPYCLREAPKRPTDPVPTYLCQPRPAIYHPRLGGPEWHKNATVALFVFLWFLYIALSAAAA